MAGPPPLPQIFRFGAFEVDIRAGELRKHGVKIKLQEQPFKILAMLIEHPGEVVTREEVRRRLWPEDTFVDFDKSLSTAINKLREALGDEASSPRFVDTLPRRGYRFIAPVQEPIPSSVRHRAVGTAAGVDRPLSVRRVLTVAALLLLAGAVAGTFRWYQKRAAGSPAAVGAKPSVAVLPFQNLSGDPQNEYFSDGITEEITNKLSRIQSLEVTARTSAARYKGTKKDIKEIGRELGVRYVMEGSVRKAGSRVRISAQLIDPLTGFHLWADDFDGELKDVFAVQEQTALKIAKALNLRLSPQEQQALRKRYTENPQAYDAYLRGRALIEYYDNPEKLQAAREHFEQALQADANYPLAIAGLSQLENHYYRTLDPSPQRLQRAEKLARRALVLDPQLAQGYVTLGMLYGNRFEYARGAEQFRQAIRLEPQNAFAWSLLAWALTYVQPPDTRAAEEAAREAIRLQPGLFSAYYQLGRALFLQRRYPEAIASFQHALELAPDFGSPHLGLAQVFLAQGDYDGALAELNKLNPQYRSVHHALVQFSFIYAARGDNERALATLEKALAGGYRDFAYLESSPYLAPLRSDPRFQDLLRRMNLPQ